MSAFDTPPSRAAAAGGASLLLFLLVSVMSFATSGVRALRWASLGLLLALSLGPFVGCLLLLSAGLNGQQAGWLGSLGLCVFAVLAAAVGAFFWYFFRVFSARPWDPDAPVFGVILNALWSRRPRT